MLSSKNSLEKLASAPQDAFAHLMQGRENE